ncbi:MAG: nucleotide exchange factor GrpE [Alphaproteobacteria bacterium]|nr:nucleotide exchange factor GrpE [Alphaproteobacteria bacterium]
MNKDIQRQEDPMDEPSSASAPTLEEALQQIAELDKKLAETTDKMLRALAEAENTRRRAERERQDTAKFSVASFARDLLTVSDNLRRALNAIPAAERGKSEQLNSIFTGVESTERELLRVFESNGIRKIDPLHQKFDPNLHEVLFEAPAPGTPSGTIIQVVEPGYMIHERLLRPARVGVAKNDGNGDSKKVDQSA